MRQWGVGNLFKRTGGVSTSRDFDVVDIQSKEFYVGQLFGAIRTRANRVAELAKEHTKTRLFDDPDQELDVNEDQHPYLKLVNESPSFANTYFWKALSTFLDLTGTAYVFVLRNSNKTGTILGEAKEFKIVNPYNLTKVVKGSDTDEYRYIETRGAAWREIPKEQLIVINTLNPFNLNDGYAMVDAARDDQFSIQQARSYTRTAVGNNVGQRGMLAPEVVLGDEDFANFEKAVGNKGQGGKFLTTNAPVKYTDMQIDLDKLALDKINTISVEALVMVTGASKTLLGVEQSQISQEQAKVQRELFTENHGIPQLTDILDALNQDYKNSYKSEYESKKLEMYVDSPLKVDKDSELKDANIEKVKAETAKVLIDTGYDPDSVNTYLDLDDELKFEERQPKGLPIPAGKLMPDEEKPDKEEDMMEEQFRNVLNRFSPGLEVVVKGYESSLQNQITNIEGQILQAAMPNLTKQIAKNAISQDGVLNKKDQERLERELALALAAFYVSLVVLFAGQTVNKRFAQFHLPSQFTMTPEVNKAIKARSSLSAESHLKTFTNLLYNSAKDAAVEGLGRDAIVSRLTGQFPSLAKTNATRIARTEAYHAVNMSQYEADKQFLEQNNITQRAYKRWVVQSKNPCQFCIKLNGTEVPFAENFLDLGDSIKAEFPRENGTVTREYVAGYQPIEAGTLHPNCSCAYELVIRES